MTAIKRKYYVKVKTADNKIEECRSFLSAELAIQCFNDFHKQYSYYHKIVIESVIKNP